MLAGGNGWALWGAGSGGDTGVSPEPGPSLIY